MAGYVGGGGEVWAPESICVRCRHERGWHLVVSAPPVMVCAYPGCSCNKYLELTTQQDLFT